MNKTLIQWQEPQAVRKHTSKKQLKGCWTKLAIIMLIATSLITVVYFAMSKLPVEENFFKIIPVFLLLAFCILTYGFVIHPYLIRFFKQKYAFTEKGIKLSDYSNGFYRWNKITDYSIEDSTDFPGLKILTVIHKGQQRTFHLSDELPLDELLTILSTRITKQPTKLKTKLSFSKAERIYMFIFCLVCSGLLVCTMQYLKTLGEWAGLVLILMIYFGPGTLVILQLKGFKALKSSNGFSWAIMINLLACGITAKVLAYLEMYKFFN